MNQQAQLTPQEVEQLRRLAEALKQSEKPVRTTPPRDPVDNPKVLTDDGKRPGTRVFQQLLHHCIRCQHFSITAAIGCVNRECPIRELRQGRETDDQIEAHQALFRECIQKTEKAAILHSIRS